MFSTFVGLGRFINCQRPDHIFSRFERDFFPDLKNDVESDCFYDFTGSEICYFIIFRTFPLMRCNALSVDFGSFPRIPAI